MTDPTRLFAEDAARMTRQRAEAMARQDEILRRFAPRPIHDESIWAEALTLAAKLIWVAWAVLVATSLLLLVMR